MIRVVAAVIVRDGKILICQRRHDDSFPLKWEFPGGKIEPGEDDSQALAREIREELGVEAKVLREIQRVEHHYSKTDQRHPNPAVPNRAQKKAFSIAFFLVDIGAQQPKNLAFETFDWRTPSEIRSYDFLEANGALVRRIAAGEIKID
jgi:8-oxo-dGTP diphosphatase